MIRVRGPADFPGNLPAKYSANGPKASERQFGRSAALLIDASERMNQAYHEQMSLRESRLIGKMDMRHPQNLADALNRQERMHQLNIDIQFMMSLGQNARTLLDQLLKAQ